MRRVLISATVWIVVALSMAQAAQGQGAAGAQPTHPRADLSKPFTPLLGDMIALSMSQIMTGLRQITDAPTIVVFDRDASKIAIFVYGSRTSLDGAKSSLDDTRTKAATSIAIVGNLYHVSLQPTDFAYVYYHEGKERVRWEDGKYTVGAE